jgi:hypothetical protein
MLARHVPDPTRRGAGNLKPLDPEWDQTSWTTSRPESIEAQGGRSGHEIRTWIAAYATLSGGRPVPGRLSLPPAHPGVHRGLRGDDGGPGDGAALTAAAIHRCPRPDRG